MILDKQLAIKKSDGNEILAKELFVMLINELPTLFNNVLKAIPLQNSEILMDNIHKLQGSIAYCGVPDLKSAIKNLAASIKNQNKIEEDIKTVEKSVQILINHADNFLGENWC